MERYQSYRNRKTLSAHADQQKGGKRRNARETSFGSRCRVVQRAGIRRVIGGGVFAPKLRWFCVLLRARESWLEVLGDEERLKLEQRPVTFCGGLILQEQEEERGRQSSMAGQRRASACLSFRQECSLPVLTGVLMGVLMVRAATPQRGLRLVRMIKRFYSYD